MTRGKVVFSGLAVAAMACAGQSVFQPPPGEGQYFTLRTAVSTQQMRLDGDRLFGPDVEVSRLSDGYRGHVGDRVVDLRTSKMKVFGSIGSQMTELYVEERPDGFVLKGLYGGRLGTIELSSDRVAGSIGSCTYDMVRAEKSAPRYTGRRACSGHVGRRSGQVGSAEISLPGDLGGRRAEDRAALMAIFLGQ